MDWLPRIEAAILAHGKERDIEGWKDWAQKRFQKALGTFTLEDWQAFLAQVQEAAARLAAKKPQAGAGKRQEATPAPQEVAADLPASDAPTGVIEGAERSQADLWQQEEAAEKEQG